MEDFIESIRDDVERKRHKKKPFDEKYVRFLHNSIDDEVSSA